MKIKRFEGFWRGDKIDSGQTYLPWPTKSNFKNRKSFLKKLEIVEEAFAKCEYYKGWSNCRICDCNNGSQSWILDGWEWPSGFSHYIEKHGVKPSAKFIKFIERKAKL